MECSNRPISSRYADGCSIQDIEEIIELNEEREFGEKLTFIRTMIQTAWPHLSGVEIFQGITNVVAQVFYYYLQMELRFRESFQEGGDPNAANQYRFNLTRFVRYFPTMNLHCHAWGEVQQLFLMFEAAAEGWHFFLSQKTESAVKQNLEFYLPVNPNQLVKDPNLKRYRIREVQDDDLKTPSEKYHEQIVYLDPLTQTLYREGIPLNSVSEQKAKKNLYPYRLPGAVLAHCFRQYTLMDERLHKFYLFPDRPKDDGIDRPDEEVVESVRMSTFEARDLVRYSRPLEQAHKKCIEAHAKLQECKRKLFKISSSDKQNPSYREVVAEYENLKIEYNNSTELKIQECKNRCNFLYKGKKFKPVKLRKLFYHTIEKKFYHANELFEKFYDPVTQEVIFSNFARHLIPSSEMARQNDLPKRAIQNVVFWNPMSGTIFKGERRELKKYGLPCNRAIRNITFKHLLFEIPYKKKDDLFFHSTPRHTDAESSTSAQQSSSSQHPCYDRNESTQSFFDNFAFFGRVLANLRHDLLIGQIFRQYLDNTIKVAGCKMVETPPKVPLKLTPQAHRITGHTHYFELYDEFQGNLRLLGLFYKKIPSWDDISDKESFYEHAFQELTEFINISAEEYKKRLDKADKILGKHKRFGLRETTTSLKNCVTFRHIAEIYRAESFNNLAYFFAQVALAMHMINTDYRVVSLTIDGKEHGETSQKYYTRHMEILAWLGQKYHSPPVALHGGEFTRSTTGVHEEVLSNALRAPCDVGSKRLGHGLSIECDTDPHDLVARMKAQEIAVEICPTSNFRLAGVDLMQHAPLRRFFRDNLPVVVCTDNQGLFDITLNEEIEHVCVTAAQHFNRFGQNQKLYQSFLQLLRNSATYSFPRSTSIYKQNGTLRRPFESVTHHMPWKPSMSAKKILALSPRAVKQVRVERGIVAAQLSIIHEVVASFLDPKIGHWPAQQMVSFEKFQQNNPFLKKIVETFDSHWRDRAGPIPKSWFPLSLRFWPITDSNYDANQVIHMESPDGNHYQQISPGKFGKPEERLSSRDLDLMAEPRLRDMKFSMMHTLAIKLWFLQYPETKPDDWPEDDLLITDSHFNFFDSIKGTKEFTEEVNEMTINLMTRRNKIDFDSISYMEFTEKLLFINRFINEEFINQKD